MTHKVTLFAVILTLGLVVVLSAAALAATAAGFDLSWWSVDGGGGKSKGGSYILSGTIGQPEAGEMSGNLFTLTGGFWNDWVVAPPLLELYLPLVSR